MSQYNNFDFRDMLRQIEWEDGKMLEREVVGSYRHAITLVCSSLGRTKGEFANGMFPYFAYGELLSPKGEWIKYGNNVVPVLPDGRFLMVVEQRPVLLRYPDHPRIVEDDNHCLFDLGPCGALEFPGGAYNPGESFTAGILRELHEETNVEEQRARVVRRVPSIYPFSADLALEMTFSVVYLSGLSFSGYVEDDGGLRVIALNEWSVMRNIWRGVISSAQSALTGWAFYQEVRAQADDLHTLISNGYIAVDDVQIVKPK